MDYSGFRRSENVEDHTNDPWRHLNSIYASVGMSAPPLQMSKDILHALMTHPFSEAPPPPNPGAVDPSSQLSQDAGINNIPVLPPPQSFLQRLLMGR